MNLVAAYTHSGGETYRPSGEIGALTAETETFVPYYDVCGTLKSDKGRGWPVDAEMSDKLAGNSHGVRRLTPTECERLQGFPDGWTALPGAPDSRRYAAMGDAVTVPVARWIGERLAASA